MPLTVLFEDNHVLAASKPAGMLVQGDASGDPTLLAAARDYRKQHESKRGNVYVGLVHRLDRPVSGVVLFAKTSSRGPVIETVPKNICISNIVAWWNASIRANYRSLARFAD